MKHFYKLKKYSQIKFVIEKGQKIALKSSVLYKLDVASLNLREKLDGKCVIAFLLSKKFGNAVKRNRARRLLFASLTSNIETINKNFAHVFIPRAKLLNMNFKELSAEIERAVLGSTENKK